MSIYTFGPEATDQIQLAWMLLITVTVLALAIAFVSVCTLVLRRITRLEYQLKEEGCYAYTTGKLSTTGGVFDRFHREAHARTGADARIQQ